MSPQRYSTDLTDSRGIIIKEWLPPPASTGRPRLDLREVFNAICYVLKGGIQWRLRPSDLPKWQSVYSHFRRWRKEGIWRRVHDALRMRPGRPA